MKQALLLSLLVTGGSCYAQQPLPVVKARSDKATVWLESGLLKSWTIDPGTQLDVFSTPKLTRSETIHFNTDTDTIVVRLNPGEHKDFIVLLNGKDSCLTRIQSPEPKNFSNTYPEIHDTIPLGLNEHNTIYVTSVLDGKDTLRLNFDTGSSDITLTNDVLRGKLQSALKLYHTPYDLQLGKHHYQSRVYPAELSGHGTEGRFGWDLFDGWVVELNHDRQVMVVHSKLPAYVSADQAFTRLNMQYVDNVFVVESSIVQDDVEQRSWFLFDTGYERTAMLDSDLLKESRFPSEKMEVISKMIMKGGQGNEIPVITSDLALLKLGDYELTHVPVQMQTANKPLQGANIHILGNEVLKRFNVILDFQQNIVYLKPNRHFNDAYTRQ